jgi:hypothetical protein
VDVLKAAAALALALVASCYQPQYVDCTVTCQGAGDCAPGQICNSGRCASPDVPTCGNDDAAPAPDAHTIDAVPVDAAAPDANVDDLHVVVQGRGKVVIDALAAECVGTNGTPGDCHYAVEDGTSLTFLPVETSPASPFSAWTTPNCSAETGACTLVIDAPAVLVGAQFQ